MNEANNAAVDKNMTVLCHLFFVIIVSKEATLIRNKMLVAGDIRPIGKLFSNPGESPIMRSNSIGYPVDVSINMIRHTTKTKYKMIFESARLMRFCRKLRAAKLVRIKHKAVTGAIGTELSPIPASNNASANHPVKARIHMIIITQNAQIDIFSLIPFICNPID